jgi:hypothetical protein
MNIKSLLLGSAAALVAVSGARAADAVVVAEPEPMEYVRVCDTYGAGFYYIPGTETCLKIGGLVRYQIDWSDEDDGWKKYARVELKFDARSETEYGTFGRYIRLRGTTYSGYLSPDPDVASKFENSGGVQIQDAVITLGGLGIGLTDTLYDGGLLGEYDTGGGDRVHFINYTFDLGNGISLAAGVEEADYDYDYTPNFVGKLTVVQGWGALTAYAAYDATAEEWAAKAIAAIKVSDQFKVNLMAIYNSDDSFYSTGSDWSAAGELVFKANDKLEFVLGAQWFGDTFYNGGDDYAVGAVVNYTIVKDFKAKLAVNYNDGDSYTDGEWSGFLRLDAGF